MSAPIRSFLCGLLLAATAAWAADEPRAPLLLGVAIEGGPEFQPGDAIVARLSVTPADGGEYEFTEDLVLDLRERLVVRGPDGTRLVSGAELTERPAIPPRWLRTSASTPYTRTVRLDRVFPSLPHLIGRVHYVRDLGSYELTFQGRARVRPIGGGQIWSGELSSAPMTFTLLPPEAERLDRWRTVLLGEASSPTQLREALRFVGYFEPEERIRLLEHAARSRDTAVLLEVARSLRQVPLQCPGGLDLVKSMLGRSQAAFIRAELMAALERFPCDEARELLVREVRGRAERSYRAAVVVLGRIGDAACVPALEAVAEGDPTPWVRERARESIRQVEQRAN